MILHNEDDIVKLISEDKWMMGILLEVKQLQLPDWWVCAGFVRSKIWDTLHEFEQRTTMADIDVIYLDRSVINESHEKILEQKLMKLSPGIPWSVKNQARMHSINDLEPYDSCIDAMAKFPETATALGVKLDSENNIILAAPWGIEDVLQMKVMPTPFFSQSDKLLEIYKKRVNVKNWSETWGKVTVLEY
ncbi:nucleotidyltransferase family protein [Pseudalkalibacillus hwajinpoensis]|uniref:Nucleotidyltransferase family protein n=1 Tax=Guptibacillus hwajinpoensis TaxID=208199 RepID=A0A4U1MNP3_9BACL|nr:nucleotidyltransferase family protein [Pseudalkalibacillus hwajinpoensis]TKD72376.1 nucleotidyltransferase family protein [Pseudalkalibacillus hwajinpoensis]